MHISTRYLFKLEVILFELNMRVLKLLKWKWQWEDSSNCFDMPNIKKLNSNLQKHFIDLYTENLSVCLPNIIFYVF